MSILTKKIKAFTLVEVMIVVAIIALLAAIAIPNLLRAKISANESTAQANLKAIANALENYAAIHSQYPTDANLLLGSTPPYLSIDFFNGLHGGYSFTFNLDQYTYSLIATPSSPSAGNKTFTMTTGAELSVNE